MKKSLLMAGLIVSSLSANENYVELGMMYGDEKNNFSSESNANISNYDSGKGEGSVNPYLSFNYTKELNDILDVFIETEEEKLRGGIALGPLEVGAFTAVAKDEVWENPYLLNQSRTSTEVSESGFFLSYEHEVGEYEFEIGYENSQIKLDSEKSIASLDRDATKHKIELESSFKNYLLNVEYEKYDADGNAASYDSYLVEFVYEDRITRDITFRASLGMGNKSFKETNPILDKKIDSDITEATVMAKWVDPFNYNKNTYLTTALQYSTEDANHNFYDKSELATMVAFGYRF